MQWSHPRCARGQPTVPGGRPVRRALGMEFEFIKVRQAHFYGHSAEWVDRRHRIPITDPERTLLDMVVDPGVFGSLQAAIETVASNRGRINMETLVSYTLRYDVGAVIKRVGWILDTLNVPESVLRPLLEYPTTSYTLLDVTGPREGAAVARWRLYDNLSN